MKSFFRIKLIKIDGIQVFFVLKQLNIFIKGVTRSVPSVPFRSVPVPFLEERNGTERGVCGPPQGTERNGTGGVSDLEERNGTERGSREVPVYP